MTFDAVDQLAVNTIRSLSMDMIQILGTQGYQWEQRRWPMCFGITF